MIYCGTDIIEIERIEKAINENKTESKNLFLDKIYTLNEINYCESKGRMKYQHYAARFAAKEAVFKAISNLLNNKYELSWKDAEIINDNMGRPQVKLNNISKELKEKNINIDISLSHCKEYAVATALLQYE